MTIFLDKKNRKGRDNAANVARDIIHTKLEDIAKGLYKEGEEIIIDPDSTLMKNRAIQTDDIKTKLEVLGDVRSKAGKILIKSKKPETRRKKFFEKIAKLDLKGASGIRRVLVAEESGEWVIRTDGSNLSKVLETKGVDPTRSWTNHFHEITKTLGVEAARNSLIKEAVGVLEEQGLDVDIRHIMLVADIMTATGEVRQIGRHGISGSKSSVLARAAFEITVPNIVDASIKGEADPLLGVTENVIVGQSIPIGTGLVNLYMSNIKDNVEHK
jgi:DNA-directed RNA polymerase beta' subunit